MNKYISDRRCSLNSLNGLQMQPVAESTCLNLNNSSNSRSFTWGFTSISPKQRSNSAYCLSSDDDETTRANNSQNVPLYALQRRKITKIDPKIYADVKSRGLASRIVKYHEGGNTTLNRSSSLRNLYSKPGQFPVVNLKKAELPLRATKQSLCMTRIAPPRNTVFQGTTLSSLLRSNSIVNVNKPDEHGEHSEHVSCENRPILHPPPTETESAPTRSVLEKLKEISRKRINNEDLNCKEANKKYCNRNTLEVVDGCLQQSVNESSSNNLKNNIMKNHKRQRETSSIQSELLNSHLEHSPSDQAKKRLCNYNNDISSSLSSSMNYRAKKEKLTEPNRNQSTSTQLDFIQQENESNYNSDANVEKLSQGYSEVITNTITPTTTYQSITTITPALVGEQYQMGSIPKRTASAPAQIIKAATVSEGKTEVKTKPRLTLFNKNYAESIEGNTNAISNDDNNTIPDTKAIPFIKPKKLSAVSGKKNPIIEKTQKSKLALMLSGLRGELYLENDYDQVDAKETKKIESELKTSSSSADTTMVVKTTIVAPISVDNSANAPLSQDNTNKVQTSNEITIPTASTAATTAIATTTTNTMATKSPLVGIKITPQTSTSTATLATGFVYNGSNSSSVISVPSTAFSFSAPKTTPSTTTTSTIGNTQLQQTESSAIVAAASAAAINTPAICTAAKTTAVITNTISNHQIAATPTTITSFVTPSDSSVSQSTPATFNAFNMISKQTAAATNPEAQTKQFSFGMNTTAAAATAATTASTSGTLTTFNFSATATTSSEAITKPTLGVFGTTNTSANTSLPSAIQKSLFTFGNTTTSLTTTTNTTNVVSNNLGFTFNATSSTNTPKPQAIATPITLSSSLKTGGFSANLQNTFKFDTTTATTTTTTNTTITNNASNIFTFGKVAQPTATKAESANPASIFSAAIAAVATVAKTTATATATTSIFGTITSNTTAAAAANNNEQPALFAGGVTQGIFSNLTTSASAKPTTASLFTFGNKTDQNSTTGGFSFSTATVASNNSGFSFATNNTSTTSIAGNTTTTTSFTSLVNADQNKTFSFGNNVAANASLNLFGSSNSTTLTTVAATANSTGGGGGGFSFSNSSNPTSTTNANAASVFSFGTSNNTNTQSTNANSSTTATATKPFAFGSGGQANLTFGTTNALNPTSSVSIFAIDKTSNKPMTQTQPLFNFGNVASPSTTTTATAATTITNNLLVQNNSNQNIFAATNQNSINGRPMRRATRRLQKS